MLIREKGGMSKGTLMVVYRQLCVACLDFFLSWSGYSIWLVSLAHALFHVGQIMGVKLME